MNLQECYWIEGRALSSALQKCRTLTSLNVLGCSVTKKNLCSVLKQNGNIRSLAWSIQASDLRLITSPSHPTPLFREFLVSFCSELAIVFTGLDELTIWFPVHLRKHILSFLQKAGMPVICSELCLQKFVLRWFDVSQRMQCFEIVFEGSGCQFPRRELNSFSSTSMGSFFHDVHVSSLQALAMQTVGPELERGALRTFIWPHFTFIPPAVYSEPIKWLGTKSSVVNLNLGALVLRDSDSLMTILSVQSLRYLNLTGSTNVTGHMLQVIATSSPNLECLNLQDCPHCLKPVSP